MADKNAEKAEKRKQQALQQKYMEYQMSEQQLKQFQEQLEKLDQQKNEAQAVGQALDDFNSSKDGDEVLVPISGGIFFKTKRTEDRNFLVNVGAGIVVEKDIDGVKALVDNQVSEIAKYHSHLMAEFTKLAIRHQSIEEDLKRLVED
ncbi:TPA: prefoldin subunit alpha [Candidatus Woesearchaeota archaeon]|nr:prefoldin subunit alpha [Candidatus Woesearchaeota archaeon]